MLHNCDLADDILSQAKRLGASGAAVNVSKASGFDVKVRMGAIDTISHNQDRGINVTVYFGKRSGSASTTDLAPEAIQLTVKKACDIAKYTEEDDCAGLADQELMAYDYPDLDLCHPWHLKVDEAIQLAQKGEAAGLASDERIVNSEGVNVDLHQASYCYANSHGFMGYYDITRFMIDCELLAGEGGEKQRDYDYSVARDHHDLESVAKIAQHAADRAVKRLGAKTLTTRQAPVIFMADVAKGLWGALTSAISGGSLYRKASFLLDHLDKNIFPSFINIDERPHLQKGLGSAPFDSEGVITKPKYIVQDGCLRSYLLNSYAARKLKLQSTGNAGGVYNMFIASNAGDLTELLKLMGNGLLVTELIGQGVNIVTGDYSRGACGFWVENGEIQYPVQEITIAGNLKDMFLNIVAVGNDIDKRSNINTGSVLVSNMTIAGS